MNTDLHKDAIGKKRDLSILIIDDDPIVAKTITKILKATNPLYYIQNAASVEEALDLIKKTYWDTILLDLSLPNKAGGNPDPKHGIAALEMLTDELKIQTPIIAITGYHNDELSDVVLDKGAYYFLNKPVRPKSLSAIVKNSTRFKMSGYDGLTGLLNRETFEERLKSEFERVRRSNLSKKDSSKESQNGLDSSLSIIFFDADNFKEINDTFSHLAGDQILKRISSSFVDESLYKIQNGKNSLLKYIIRPYDLAARFGGDEFCIFLPETSHPNALVVAKRIREQLINIRIQDVIGADVLSESISTLSLSIGMATYPIPNVVESYIDLIDLADNAMYASKEKRKGEIFGYDSTGSIVKFD